MLKLTLKRVWTNSSDLSGLVAEGCGHSGLVAEVCGHSGLVAEGCGYSGLVAEVCGHPNDGNFLIRSVVTTSDKQLRPTES